MVTASTFRLPGILAMTVATVDAMSGGRVELGLGTGWYEAEHRAFGVPFPNLGERFDRLEEQLTIITGLWSTPDGERFSFNGQHYQLTDNPALPKPVQRPYPPLIVGGLGHRRTPTIAARFAKEYNAPPFTSVADVESAFCRARRACEARGRDPSSLLYSAAQPVIIGSDGYLRRKAVEHGFKLADLRSGGLVGSAAEVVDKIGRFEELGASRLYLQLLNVHDFEQLVLVAEQVL
jgi:alkanesulfonate monooxygenase SsuD/methylene tetrahydromethanopterin reductase-like flavin-dependent oxidoreductase (luciferase family)